MNDRYATHQKGVNSPGDDLKQITFSDTVDMDDLPRFIHVNTTGTLRVLLEKSQSAEDIYVVAGNMYPYRVRRIFVTGTTAGMNVKAGY